MLKYKLKLINLYEKDLKPHFF